eukprot:519353_1
MIKYHMVPSPLHLHSLQINGYQYYTPSIQSVKHHVVMRLILKHHAVMTFKVLFSKTPCSDDINIKTPIQEYGYSINTNDDENINVYCATMVATPPNLIYFNITNNGNIYDDVEDNLYAIFYTPTNAIFKDAVGTLFNNGRVGDIITNMGGFYMLYFSLSDVGTQQDINDDKIPPLKGEITYIAGLSDVGTLLDHD